MAKGTYVDGFVFAVPKKSVKAYKKMATDAARVWKRFGALEYYECMGDDLKVKPQGGMRTRSFTETAKAKGGETVWFSFIVYKNRAHRDMVNKNVMAYFNKKYSDVTDFSMPFDMRKMSYGGFKAVVRA